MVLLDVPSPPLHAASPPPPGEDQDKEPDPDDDELCGVGFMFDQALPKRKSQQAFPRPPGHDPICLQVMCVDDNPGALQSGHYLWPAAPGLARLLASSWEDMVMPTFPEDGGHVLELGAGCGLCGLVVAHLPRCCSVTFTDHDPGTLNLIRSTYTSISPSPPASCLFLPLRWGSQDHARGGDWPPDWQDRRFDLLLGSDLIYSLTVVEPLLRTVKALLAERAEAMFVLSSSFALSEDIEKYFDQTCLRLNLHRETLSGNAGRHMRSSHPASAPPASVSPFTKSTKLCAYSCPAAPPPSRITEVKVSRRAQAGPALLHLPPRPAAPSGGYLPILLTHDDSVREGHALVHPYLMLALAYPEATPIAVACCHEEGTGGDELPVALSLTIQPCASSPPTTSRGQPSTSMILSQYSGCLVLPGCSLLLIPRPGLVWRYQVTAVGRPCGSLPSRLPPPPTQAPCLIGQRLSLTVEHQPSQPHRMPRREAWGEYTVDVGDDGSRGVYAELQAFVTEWRDCDASLRPVQMGSVLLAGPSGVGKTRLVHQLLDDLTRAGCDGRYVRGMEMFAKLLQAGVKEDLLVLFDLRRRPEYPSVLVIDDFDTFLYEKEEAGTSEMQRALRLLRAGLQECRRAVRGLAVVLVSAQDIEEAGGVAVSGKVRLLRSLQPSLYERVIAMRPPTTGERRVLLRHLLRLHLTQAEGGVDDEAIISHLAGVTGGYVAGDLLRLCRTASLLASASPCSPMVASSYLHRARALTPPSQLRGLDVLSPDPRHFSWSAFGGYDHVKSRLQQLVGWPWQHADTFLRMGVKPSPGILLYGPSGCGKTQLARIIATEAQANFVHVHTGDVLSKYLGGSEARLRGLFAQARQAAPCILFFDELDCLAANREGGDAGDAGSVYSRVLSTFLNELDGIGGKGTRQVLVLAATNRKEAIDAALLRPGRLQEAVHVPLPEAQDYEAIVRVAVKDMPLSGDVDLPEVSEALVAKMKASGRLERVCGANLVAVCRKAAMEALRESFDSQVVGMRHFLRAISRVGEGE